MNKKCILSYIASILALVAFISCASPAGGGSEGSETGLAVRMPGRALTSYDKTTVSIFTVTIKSSSYKETKSAGSGETITFSQIPVGTYEVTALAKDASGTTIAKTKDPVTVVIEQDKITETTVNLSLLKYALVHFDLNLGIAADGTSNIPDQNVTEGEYATAPANPTKTGYVFGGWKLLPPPGAMSTAAPINLATYPINDAITFQAIWKQTYSVTFDMNGGNGSNTTIEVPMGENILASQIPTPTRTGSGWVFAGWECAGDPVAATDIASTPITTNKTYTASWDFTVNYYSEGTLFTSTAENILSGSNAFYPTSDIPTSATAIKVFKGWTNDPSATGTPFSGDISVSTSDLDGGTYNLYAIWEDFEFTAHAYQLDSEITLSVSAGPVSTNSKTLTYSAITVTFKAKGSGIYEMFYGATSQGTGSIQYLEVNSFNSEGTPAENKNRFYFVATYPSTTHYLCSSNSGLTDADTVYRTSSGSATDAQMMSAFGTAP